MIFQPSRSLRRFSATAKKSPSVAQITKTGFVFVFDRLTGKPLFPIEERPVPQERSARRIHASDAAVPCQACAAYEAEFPAEELANVTPEHRKFCEELIRELYSARSIRRWV